MLCKLLEVASNDAQTDFMKTKTFLKFLIKWMVVIKYVQEFALKQEEADYDVTADAFSHLRSFDQGFENY